MLAIFFPGWEMQETGSLVHTSGQNSASAPTNNGGEAPGQRKRPRIPSTQPLSLHFNTWQNRELCLNERHYEEGCR
jgi:hypothetical protein